jgi:hypothetical protein
VLSKHIPDGLADLRASWRLRDIMHAHDFLDEIESREAAAAAARQGE